jgi:hypothetical protein
MVCKRVAERISSLRRGKRTGGAPSGSCPGLGPFSGTGASNATSSASNREALLTVALNAF